ncbi:MAG: amino acid ABC transporter substrate-binding protein, partial [Ruminococcaceae bacterium]|nr:amino acid ABC transporter substrate-binding protein [Oscillospiraceae bacterium]
MKKLLALLMAACMIFSFAACKSEEPAKTDDGGSTNTEPAGEATGTLKIGGIGPVTGVAAAYGLAVQHGAEIAVEEINALGGMKIEFQMQDDEHDAEKSVNAYNTLKDWGMEVLMGTVTTNPCIAVSSKSNADKIFTLTPSASS